MSDKEEGGRLKRIEKKLDTLIKKDKIVHRKYKKMQNKLKKKSRR